MQSEAKDYSTFPCMDKEGFWLYKKYFFLHPEACNNFIVKITPNLVHELAFIFIFWVSLV